MEYLVTLEDAQGHIHEEYVNAIHVVEANELAREQCEEDIAFTLNIEVQRS